MSAPLPLPAHLEQPTVPPLVEHPPLASSWLGEQPSARGNPTPPFEPDGELHWQSLNRKPSPDFVLSGLEDVYVIDDRSAVAAFIGKNRLRSLLLLARDPLNVVFGETALKRLAIVSDDEGFNTLFCLIAISGNVHEARQALESFDQRWWLDHCEQADGNLNFDFELG